MTRRLLLLAGIFASLVLPPAAVSAQSPFMLAIGGGGSLPLGDFGDAANMGWHALASVGVSTLMQPLGLRLDVAHNRFGAKGGAGSAGQAITSGTLNVTYRLPMTNSPLSPYIIAGAGAYHFQCTGGVSCGTATRFGWNGGLGTKIASLGLKWFLEGRFHFVDAEPGSVKFAPVTLGLIF
ncbi:MAG TPA: outer membrane beta-barrel protein [Gemmatimonadaceae bacterium]|nr:outer membrane beta-barrel protein [Gemmatimonadaceae bacterium]